MKKSKLFSRIGLTLIALPWVLVLGYYAFAAFNPSKATSGILFIFTYGTMFGIVGALLGAPFLVRSLLYQKWEREEERGIVSSTTGALVQPKIPMSVMALVFVVLLAIVLIFVFPSDFVPTIKNLLLLFPKVW